MARVVFAALALLLALPAWSQTPVAGKEYREVPPQPTKVQAGKIEVVEFFMYDCQHCYQMEPRLAAWRKRLGPDVAHRSEPWGFTKAHSAHLQMHYILRSQRKEDALRSTIMEALQVKKIKLDTREQVVEFLSGYGIPSETYMRATGDAAISFRSRDAITLGQGYRVDAVPAVGVGGRYFTSLSMAGGPEQLLGVADQLIARARAELPKP
jgi:thiol:disulfide interchange protein DsbA